MTRAQAIEAGAMSDDDTRTIAMLRRELHDANNRLTVKSCAVELIALELGLPTTTPLSEILAAIRVRR